MRSEPNIRLEQLRVEGPVGANAGCFRWGPLQILIGNGGGWDHVSVSRGDRCPTWDEMDKVKRLCFRDDEVVVQFHITDGKINVHPYCLHLWRPQSAPEMAAEIQRWEASGEVYPEEYRSMGAPGAMPLPPREFV